MGIISLMYAGFYWALAASWLAFVSLNAIADIATKSSDMSVASSALFVLFGLFTVATAIYFMWFKARQKQGHAATVSILTFQGLSAEPNCRANRVSPQHSITC